MTQPLPEPCLLISDNCTACKGLGTVASGDRCTDCDGSGREVREMPMSAAWELTQRQHQRLTAPPPSMVRDEAIGGESG